MGFVSTLMEPGITWPPEKQREFLGIVNEELARLNELTEQLLDYTRLETATLRVSRKLTVFGACGCTLFELRAGFDERVEQPLFAST